MDIVNVRLLTSIVARSWHTEARDSATRLRQVLRCLLVTSTKLLADLILRLMEILDCALMADFGADGLIWSGIAIKIDSFFVDQEIVGIDGLLFILCLNFTLRFICVRDDLGDLFNALDCDIWCSSTLLL